MNAVPKIRLRGVKKSFGEKVVLDGVDLDVAAGESVIIIGGSGTGKSVTLKCILGLLEPEEGTIEVDGEDATKLGGRERERVKQRRAEFGRARLAAKHSGRRQLGRNGLAEWESLFVSDFLEFPHPDLPAPMSHHLSTPARKSE